MVKLLGPHAETIFHERNELSALFVRREIVDQKCKLCEILQPHDVLHMASMRKLTYMKDIRIVIRGANQFSSKSAATPEEITSGYLAGATVVMNSLQYFDTRINDLLVDLERSLGVFVSVNMYLSPPAAQGFKAHHDLMDTMILQTAGSKVRRLVSVLESERRGEGAENVVGIYLIKKNLVMIVATPTHKHNYTV